MSRKVSTNGTITTFAGTGKRASPATGGPATAAQLYAPACVAFDAKGNAYIADQQNARVRKVAPNGTITTFAGSCRAELSEVQGRACDEGADRERVRGGLWTRPGTSTSRTRARHVS